MMARAPGYNGVPCETHRRIAPYSSLSAVIGSIRDGLSTGMSEAAIAITASAAGIVAKVQPSNGATR